MIEKIHIKNFKSIYDLEIDVGRVNLFIGENGSGKSNLLEALVFVSANQSNKLDNEFLSARGIRVTNPILMRSAFENIDQNKSIKISIGQNDNLDSYEFINENTEYSKWTYPIMKKFSDGLEKEFPNEKKETLDKILSEFLKTISKNKEMFVDALNEELDEKHQVYLTDEHKFNFKNFLIYSPEHEALRNFYNEGHIEPLGVKGEGLFRLLQVIKKYDEPEYLETIIKSLQLFDWFDGIDIPDDLSFGEKKLIIKDKYLYTEIDQRSTNEGFLFILFYITLIVAKETPKAFAIDNIDSFLNPKLCTKLIKLVIELSGKYDKQIFLTTHNPAILDGIDLNDEEQKLFVVSRNKSGHTRMKNITVENKPKSSTNEPLKLSEAFLRGYLGGLPKGF